MNVTSYSFVTVFLIEVEMLENKVPWDDIYCNLLHPHHISFGAHYSTNNSARYDQICFIVLLNPNKQYGNKTELNVSLKHFYFEKSIYNFNDWLFCHNLYDI
jgi:hypothetical protein